MVSTLFYVVFFAVGPGSIPWMITAELFSQVDGDDGCGYDDYDDDVGRHVYFKWIDYIWFGKCTYANNADDDFVADDVRVNLFCW